MGHVCVSSQRTVVFIRRLESKKRYDLSFDDDGLDNIFITPYAYKPIYSSEMTVSPLPDDFDVIVQTATAIGIIGARCMGEGYREGDGDGQQPSCGLFKCQIWRVSTSLSGYDG